MHRRCVLLNDNKASLSLSLIVVIIWKQSLLDFLKIWNSTSVGYLGGFLEFSPIYMTFKSCFFMVLWPKHLKIISVFHYRVSSTAVTSDFSFRRLTKWSSILFKEQAWNTCIQICLKSICLCNKQIIFSHDNHLFVK